MGRIKGKPGNRWVYALYKGDTFIAEGTKEEISKQTGTAVKTLSYYRTTEWIVNRKSKNGKNNRRILIRIDGYDKFADLQ